jgi:ribosomal protein L32
MQIPFRRIHQTLSLEPSHVHHSHAAGDWAIRHQPLLHAAVVQLRSRGHPGHARIRRSIWPASVASNARTAICGEPKQRHHSSAHLGIAGTRLVKISSTLGRRGKLQGVRENLTFVHDSVSAGKTPDGFSRFFHLALQQVLA